MGIKRVWLSIGSIVMIGLVIGSISVLDYFGIRTYIATTFAILTAVLVGSAIMLSNKKALPP